MSETFVQLISSMIKSSSTRQFNVLVKFIRLLISITTATALYVYYFGQVEAEFSFQGIIQTLLKPQTIVWLLFFILLFFGIYPLFSSLIILLYRRFYPPKGKISRQNLTNARKGFHKTGIDLALKRLSLEQLKEANSELQSELIDSETTSVETLGYILAVLIQYSFLYKVLLGGNVPLLWLFITSIAVILISIFLFLPFSYKVARNLLDDQFKRSIKEAEALQNASQQTTSS